MVMKPEPWGEAIDATMENSDSVDLVVLTPAGKRFNQRMAENFSKSDHIIFACGRYEGIDARVAEHYRSHARVRVHEISIGDYVLNGGEVAALVMIEAIVRLLPGVIGNPESLREESHNESGEVEYPTFTKPATWRGLDVPEVLLSGNHGEIARWRREEAHRRSQSVE
jgi:tRNA (guanine37-N1)-methyltransferase